MKLITLLLSLFTCLSMASPLAAVKKRPFNIGLCIMATGRYDQFVPELITSAHAHFCPGDNITFFVFTDGTIPQGPNIVRVEQKRLGWPFDTMMRMKVYYGQKAALAKMDYVFAIDADMRIVKKVSNTILGTRVATEHPGYVGKRGTYETDPRSLAYVPPHDGRIYFAGGFWGGTSQEFLKACKVISERIDIDLKHGITPVWHDESHLNRYFIDCKPTKILTPSYCYPEELKLPYTKRILAICKNHKEFQVPLEINVSGKSM